MNRWSEIWGQSENRTQTLPSVWAGAHVWPETLRATRESGEEPGLGARTFDLLFFKQLYQDRIHVPCDLPI